MPANMRAIIPGWAWASLAGFLSGCMGAEGPGAATEPSYYVDHHEDLTVESLPYEAIGANRILFTRESGSKSGVVSVDAVARVTSVSFSPRGALFGFGEDMSVAPGGGRIAYMASAPYDAKERSYDIYVRDIGARDGTPLGGTAGADRYSPSWSADGSKVVYTESAHLGDKTVSIVAQTPVSGATREILWTVEQPCEQPRYPALSSSGTLAFAYFSACTASSAIGIKAKGTAVIFVTVNAQIGGPDWSPDSRQIAFLTMPAGSAFGKYTLNVVDADGTNLRTYPFTLAQSVELPSHICWGADGSRLFFATREAYPSAAGPGSSHVYSIRPDGTDVTPITSMNGVIDRSVTCTR
jgi:Tol biopolymer transport system component